MKSIRQWALSENIKPGTATAAYRRLKNRGVYIGTPIADGQLILLTEDGWKTLKEEIKPSVGNPNWSKK